MEEIIGQASGIEAGEAIAKAPPWALLAFAAGACLAWGNYLFTGTGVFRADDFGPQALGPEETTTGEGTD
jgi:hypothetical protein